MHDIVTVFYVKQKFCSIEIAAKQALLRISNALKFVVDFQRMSESFGGVSMELLIAVSIRGVVDWLVGWVALALIILAVAHLCVGGGGDDGIDGRP